MSDKIVTTPNIHTKVKMDGINADILNKPVDIQELVQDQAAYALWMKLEQSEWLTTSRQYSASDGGMIDLAIIHPYLKKKILHLPQAEQDHIWELKTQKYQPARLLANQWKKKAFGTIPGPKKQKPEEGATPQKQKAYENAMVAKFAMLVPRSAELIELFGRMFTIDEVFTLCIEDWGLPVNKKMLTEFRNYYSEVIADKINHHKRSFADLRLGIKKSRLEELCWIYAELKKDYRNNRGIKFVEQMRGVLQDIRKEIEGDKIIVEGSLDINIEASVNEHLQNEVLKNISLRDLIIGRVAARIGQNPAELVYYLTRSYYNKFSGTTGPIEDAEYENIRYPNEAGYDFQMIEARQGDLQAEYTNEVQPLKQHVNLTDGEKLRQRLLNIAMAKSNQTERDQTKLTIVMTPKNQG